MGSNAGRCGAEGRALTGAGGRALFWTGAMAMRGGGALTCVEACGGCAAAVRGAMDVGALARGGRGTIGFGEGGGADTCVLAGAGGLADGFGGSEMPVGFGALLAPGSSSAPHVGSASRSGFTVGSPHCGHRNAPAESWAPQLRHSLFTRAAPSRSTSCAWLHSLANTRTSQHAARRHVIVALTPLGPDSRRPDPCVAAGSWGSRGVVTIHARGATTNAADGPS